ncbi:MAG: oligosaccharide flippase family protein [Acidobacteria bacterium]|nr:oligosaccharide flippase family protein [Acidobacteriota bacterium]
MSLARLFKQSSTYLAGDLVRRAVGFLMIPVYTTFLTPADYGIIELIELFTMVSGIVFGLASINDGMVRVYHDHREECDRSAIISTAVAGMASVSFLILLIAWLKAGALSKAVFSSTEYAGLIKAAFAATFFGSLVEVALTYWRIKQRVLYYVLFSLLQLFSMLSLNVYFIAFAHMGVWGFVLSKLITTSIGALVALALVLRETGWKVSLRFARSIGSFSVPLILSGSSFFVIHFSDRFFLNRFSTLADVGLYALAYRFGFLVTHLVGQPFESAWGISMYSDAGEAGWREKFRRVASYLMFLLVLSAVGLTLVSDETLALIADPAYRRAASLVPILAFGYAFREVGDLFRGLLYIGKRVVMFGVVTASCAALNIGLNLVFIPQGGSVGAAWATLLTWLVYMIVCWTLAYREHRVPCALRRVVVLFGLGIGVSIAGRPVSCLTTLQQWLADVALIAAFVTLVWTARYFPAEERALIRQRIAVGFNSLFALGEKG